MKLFSRKKGETNSPIKVDNEKWSMYFFWREVNDMEYPVMVFFDETYVDQIPDDYKYHVECEVFVPANKDFVQDEELMLRPEVNAQLLEKEQELYSSIEEAEIHSKIVVRMVGMARKVYRFQTRDKKALTELLQKWGDSILFVRKTELTSGKGWDTYKSTAPGQLERMQMSDLNTIQAAIENGATSEEMYLMDFFFEGKIAKLNLIKENLEEESFSTVSLEGNKMMLQRELPLDLKTIFHFTSYMLMLSMAHECVYQGWGCKIE